MRLNRLATVAALAFLSATLPATGQEKPRVSLPLQVGFFNGATALYITPDPHRKVR